MVELSIGAMRTESSKSGSKYSRRLRQSHANVGIHCRSAAPKRFKPQSHAPCSDAFLPLGVCSSGASALLEAREEAVSVIEGHGSGDGGEQPWLDHRRTWRVEPALLLVNHAIDERAEAVLLVVGNLGRRPIGEPALDLCHDSSRCRRRADLSRCRRRADLRLVVITRSGRRCEQPRQQRLEPSRVLDGRAAVGRNREEQRLFRGLRLSEEVASAESGQGCAGHVRGRRLDVWWKETEVRDAYV